VSRDGVLVVHHDRWLNPNYARDSEGRYLTERGPLIRLLTLEEIKTYDVGRLKPGTRYAQSLLEQKPSDGERIPTLAEVFGLVGGFGAKHVRFNIETKLSPNAPADTVEPEIFAQTLADAIRDFGLAARVTVQSFDWRTLKAMQKIAPEIERVCLTAQSANFDTVQVGKPGPSQWTAGLDVDDLGGSTPKLVAAAGCAVWSPPFADVTPERLAEAKALGLKVIPWTVNDLADMGRLIGMGVDGAISDYPNRLRAAMQAKGLPLPPAIAVR
jgi:glycerophosphoryl diester phosphodiesterase